jgi:hypothetical protein
VGQRIEMLEERGDRQLGVGAARPASPDSFIRSRTSSTSEALSQLEIT